MGRHIRDRGLKCTYGTAAYYESLLRYSGVDRGSDARIKCYELRCNRIYNLHIPNPGQRRSCPLSVAPSVLHPKRCIPMESIARNSPRKNQKQILITTPPHPLPLPPLPPQHDRPPHAHRARHVHRVHLHGHLHVPSSSSGGLAPPSRSCQPAR
jgi:hypothetical protein